MLGGRRPARPDEYIKSRKSHFQVERRSKVQHDEKAASRSTGRGKASPTAPTSADPPAVTLAARKKSSDGGMFRRECRRNVSRAVG